MSKANEPVFLPEENTGRTEIPKLTETSENTPKTVSTSNSQALTNASEDPIAEGTIRLHFQELPSQDKSSLGLWTWMMLRHHHLRKVPGRQGPPHLQKPNRMIMVSI